MKKCFFRNSAGKQELFVCCVNISFPFIWTDKLRLYSTNCHFSQVYQSRVPTARENYRLPEEVNRRHDRVIILVYYDYIIIYKFCGVQKECYPAGSNKMCCSHSHYKHQSVKISI